MKLSLAIGDYQIVRPLLEGRVQVEGAELVILTDMNSRERHERFFRGQFDLAEVSLSSYLAARDQGQAIRALPVFPLRRFRHGYIFIHADKGIRNPIDLAGKRIGVSSFQETGPLWMRGILQEFYGVPLASIDWLYEAQGNVPQKMSSSLSVTPIPPGMTGSTALAEGIIDAYICSNAPACMADGDPKVRRLFENPRLEETAFFLRTGLFPIMHVISVKAHLLEKTPRLAGTVFAAFEAARAAGIESAWEAQQMPLAWQGAAMERERDILGPDPWAYGMTDANTRNLETLIGYAHSQGMISRRWQPHELFAT